MSDNTHFMVTGSSQRHDTFADAVMEAERLLDYDGGSLCIFECTRVAVVTSEKTIRHTVRKVAP